MARTVLECIWATFVIYYSLSACFMLATERWTKQQVDAGAAPQISLGPNRRLVFPKFLCKTNHIVDLLSISMMYACIGMHVRQINEQKSASWGAGGTMDECSDCLSGLISTATLRINLIAVSLLICWLNTFPKLLISSKLSTSFYFLWHVV